MTAIILTLILLLAGAFVMAILFDVAVFLLIVFGFVAVTVVLACAYQILKNGIKGFVNAVKGVFCRSNDEII